jgi:hypothetical protein
VGGVVGQGATHPEEIMHFETQHLCRIRNRLQDLNKNISFPKQEVKMVLRQCKYVKDSKISLEGSNCTS